MNQNSRLSIIIVVFYGADDLQRCLASLQQQLLAFTAEIVVVSNGFNEVEKRTFLQQYPSLKWIDMPYNAGFARGNNAGMKAANGDVFLLLNPDTIAVDDSIIRCVQRLLSGSSVAAGVQLLDKDGIPQISGSHFVKGGLNHLLPIPYWGAFIRWVGYRAGVTVPGVQQARDVEEVDWISGAFLMVKRSAVETAGMLNEDFFLYGEEVEWCSRLRKVGKLVIFGDLKIVHLEGTAINKSQNLDEKGYYNLYDKKGLQLMVSNHLRVRKQYGVGWFLFLLLNYSFGVLVFWIAGTLHRLFRLQDPFAHWKKVGAFAGNVARLWQLSPRIVRNKPHFYKTF